MDELWKRIADSYTSQAINQFYQLLGSTDIIGNPVGIMNNLGRGVEALKSEPFKGLMERDAKKTVKGIVIGVKAMA